MTTQRCQNCRYSDDQGRFDWRCRRRAPVMVDNETMRQSGRWRDGQYPSVEPTGWCGEWMKFSAQPKEREPETSTERMWDAFWNGWRRSQTKEGLG